MRLRASLIALVALAFGSRLTAADSPFAAPDSDAVLTVKVKAALAADKQLAGLNLFVSVVDQVAVIGGGVPDDALADRIEALARKVAGLKEVKVACWVPTADDPLRKLVGDRLKADPVPPLQLPAARTAGTSPAARPPEASVTVRRATPADGYLLDPVMPGGRTTTELPYPTIPPPAVPTAADADPVAAAKAREIRFAGLTVSLKEGTATITGKAARHADAWDFAAVVRKAPGVTRVVVGDVAVR